jgi:hypothetical protein
LLVPISLGVVQVAQILGLVIVAGLAVWLVRRAVKRSHNRYEELAPNPVTVEAIVADAESAATSNGAQPERVAQSNGTDSEPVAQSNGAGPEPSELEAELREIYDRVGRPDSFEEAKGKVTDLAAELVERDGIEMNEALRVAYRRSLAEHRSYLAEHGLA